MHFKLLSASHGIFWQHLVAASCGSILWQHPVTASCGIILWQHPVAASCGSILWQHPVAASCGSSIPWQHCTAASDASHCGMMQHSSTINILTYSISLHSDAVAHRGGIIGWETSHSGMARWHCVVSSLVQASSNSSAL